MNTPDLGKMVGPLPLGAWIAAVGGSLGVAWWLKKNNAAKAAAQVPGTLLNTAPANQFLAPGGALPSTPTAVPSPTIPGTQFDSNQAWANYVLVAMIVKGSSAVIGQTALSKYLNGAKLDANETAYIEIALRAFGPPPYNVPTPQTTPVPTVPPPTTSTPPPPPVQPPPAPPPPRRTVPPQDLFKLGGKLNQRTGQYVHRPLGNPAGGGWHYDAAGGIVADTIAGYDNARAYIQQLQLGGATVVPGIKAPPVMQG